MNYTYLEYLDKLSVISEHYSQKELMKIKKQLYQAGIPLKAEQWISITFTASLLSAASALFTYPFLAENALAASCLTFAFVFYALKNYPENQSRRIAKQVEKDLPWALSITAAQLEIGVSFEKALQNAAGRKSALSEYLAKALLEIRNGSTVEESLSKISGKINSLQVKKAVNSLINCYQKGSGAGALKKLAEEQNAELLGRLKNYNNKLVMYSLLFIVISAVLPAMFQAVIIIGSSFMEINVSAETALLIPALAFPAINIIIIAFIRSKKP